MKNKKIINALLLSFILLLSSILLAKPILEKVNYGLDLKGGFEVLYLVECLEKN